MSGSHHHGSLRECHVCKGLHNTTPKISCILTYFIPTGIFYLIVFLSTLLSSMTTFPQIYMCIADSCSAHKQLYQTVMQWCPFAITQSPRRKKEIQVTKNLWWQIFSFVIFFFFLKLTAGLEK